MTPKLLGNWLASRKLLSPAVRISMALALFTASILLFSSFFGLFPDWEKNRANNREQICESLAVQLSLLASNSQLRLAEQTIKSFIERNQDANAGLMHTQAGLVLVDVGDTTLLQSNQTGDISTATHVKVPIFYGNRRWGTVHIQFDPLYTEGWLAWFSQSVYGLALFLALSGFFGYLFIIRRTLRELDPKNVIPERVKSAFNTLTEGVVILDEQQHILLANNVFSKKVGRTADALIGLSISTFEWSLRKDDITTYPWMTTLENGHSETGISMYLNTPDCGRYSLSTNSSPIKDDQGKIRGALITFEDISELEKQNTQLNKLINRLRDTEKEVKQKNVSLLKLANFDSLTNCYNRRALFEKFENLFQQCRNTTTNLACLMIDIDHFKSINDNYGHVVGDKAIQFVVQILMEKTRDSDLVGRYGGEEFCVVLPEITIVEASNFAERIRVTLEHKSTVEFTDAEKITVSIGICMLDSQLENPSELVDLADKALYAAKESGRNRVICWDPGLERPVVDIDTTYVDENLVNKTPVAKTHIAKTHVDKNQLASTTSTQYDNDDSNNNKQVEKIQSGVMNLLIEQISELDNIALQREEELQHHLNFDNVSGLPTRSIFVTKLTEAIRRHRTTGESGAVIIINVNMFSRINDTMGALAGDLLLMKLGRRLLDIVESPAIAKILSENCQYTLARLHADEFGLLFSELDSTETVADIAHHLFAGIKQPMHVSNMQLFAIPAIGIALYPQDAVDAEELIRKAAAAKRHIKNSCKPQHIEFYNKQINDNLYRQVRLENDLQLALKRSQLELHYQPCIEIKTGHIVSVEALIRWEHQELGAIDAGTLIQIAERTGLIHEIGEWAFTAACRQAQQWRHEGIHGVRIFVNLSAMETQNENIIEKFTSILRETEIPPSYLGVEVTETALMQNIELSAKVLQGLSELDLKIALDDFGTGHSSLSYLQQLNLDIVKIDRSFLTSVVDDPRARKLYAAIISMAQGLGLTTVAEGIENEKELEAIRQFGADRIQGYYFCKPLPASVLTQVINDNSNSLVRWVG